jgi:hypothetical protein
MKRARRLTRHGELSVLSTVLKRALARGCRRGSVAEMK